MNHLKRLFSLLLIVTLTTGSYAALAVENISVQETEITALGEEPEKPDAWVENTHPQIISLKNLREGNIIGSVRVRTSWVLNYGSSVESAQLYRTANGKTRALSPSKNVLYYWDDPHSRNENGWSQLTIYDRTAKNGTFYQYQLTTTIYDRTEEEYNPVAYSNTMSIYYLSPIRSDELSMKNSSNGKTMTISWSRNSKADGYQIQYATKEDLSNRITRKVTKNNQTSLKLSNRTPGKQYWVRVRSYKKYKGKTWYSAWSTVNLRYPE